MSGRSRRSSSRWRPLRLAAAALLLFGTALLVVALFVGATPLADAAFGLVILGAPVVGAGALLWWIESMGSRSRGDTRHHRKRRKRSANSRFTASEQAELTPSELNEYASMLGPVTEAAEAAEWAEAAKAAQRSAAAADASSSFDGLQASPTSVFSEKLPASKVPGDWSPAPAGPTPAAQVWSRQPLEQPSARNAAAAASPAVVTPAAVVPTFAPGAVDAAAAHAATPARTILRSPSPPVPPAVSPRVPAPLSTAPGPLDPLDLQPPVARRPSAQPGEALSGFQQSPVHAAPRSAQPDWPEAQQLQERWTEANLRSLPWRRFEALIEALYSQVGFRIRTQPHGNDGGLHIWLYSRHQAGPPVSVVRCEHGKSAPVGVGLLRELSGVMYAQGARRGHYVSSAGYTSEARDYAKRHGIHLIDLQGLVGLIKARGTEQREMLWQAATDSVATAD